MNKKILSLITILIATLTLLIPSIIYATDLSNAQTREINVEAESGNLINNTTENLLDTQQGKTLLEVVIKQVIEGEVRLEDLKEKVWIVCIQHRVDIVADFNNSRPESDATVVSGTIQELKRQVRQGEQLGRFSTTDPNATNPFTATESRTIAIYEAQPMRDLVPEEAYVLAHAYREGQTYNPNYPAEVISILQGYNSSDYPSDIQLALWELGLKDFITEYKEKYGVDLSNYKKGQQPSADEMTQGAQNLANEAIALREARQEIDEFVQNNGGRYVIDNTNYENCTVAYSRENQEFIIGPFTLDYVRKFYVANYPSAVGILDGAPNSIINFSGITAMTLTTDTGEIKLSKSNFIYPSDRSLQQGDENYQYPYPNEEFYISFVQDSPVNSIPKKVTGLKIKLQEINAEGKAYEITGSYKNVEWQPKQKMYTRTEYCNDPNCSGHQRFDHWEFWVEAVSVSEPEDSQNLMVIGTARIYTIIHEGEGVDIPLDIKLTIDLSGIVWEDEPSGKQSDYNGQMDGSEKGIKGVKVKAIIGGKEIASTYTDDNGKYQIKDLPVGKYDIEFEYDGQTYKTTSLLATGDETAGNVDAYIKDANNQKYFNTSKAQEAEKERIDFNNKFYEIAEGVAIGKDGTRSEMNTYKTENRVTSLITRDPETNIPYDIYKMQARTSSNNMWYPLHDNIHLEDYNKIINDTEGKSGTKTYIAIYPYMEHVNLGLIEREIADMAIKKDVLDATVTINEKKLIYEYNARAGMDNFDVDLKAQKQYSDIYYNREVYNSDYNYRIDDYKKNDLNIAGEEIHGLKVIDNELKVFVTYKITISNQSQKHKVTINELVDYFDNTYSLVTSDYYLNIQDNQGVKSNTLVAKQSYYQKSNGETGKIEWTDTSKVNTKKYDGCKTIYTDDLTNIMLQSGERLDVYLTFEVGKDSNRGILLGEKENVVEINNYSTFDINSTNKENAEGRIDRDSAPGNLKIEDINTYEDDTDNAPIINIKLHDETQRYLDGYVWEDERTENLSTGQKVGDGIRQNREELINGVTVQLVEIIDTPDGRQLEYIWREMQTGENVFKYVNSKGSVLEGTRGTVIENAQLGDVEKGQYKFFSYIPGNYIVRFKYGDTTKTVQTTAYGNGANKVSYNGQDYKSTAYQTGMNLGAEWYDLNAENLNGEKVKISDARDNELKRLKTIKYSETLQNEKAMILASPYRTPKDQDKITELINNTWMYADTAKIKVDVEHNTEKTNGMVRYIYNIKSIDLGLEQRPKTSIELDKEIEGIKLTLSDGTILIDTANGIKDNINIVKNRSKYGAQGRYTIYFDIEEIGHGATVEIQYKITIKNKSEIDTILNIPKNIEGITKTLNVGQYLGTTYYTGKEDSNAKVVTTTINKVVDYIDKNLVFRAENNENCSIVSKEDLANQKLIDAKVQESLENNKHNQILQIQSIEKQLLPGQEASANITLIKTITGENGEDDLTYDNIAEILQFTNQVGRRDSLEIVKEGYVGAIPGNQDPYDVIKEHDSGFAEQVIITNAYGENRIYYALIATIAMALIAGIIVVKKVLPNKKENN